MGARVSQQGAWEVGQAPPLLAGEGQDGGQIAWGEHVMYGNQMGLTRARSLAASKPITLPGPLTVIGRLIRLGSRAMRWMACALLGACFLKPWARYEAERVFKNATTSPLPINTSNSASLSGSFPRSRSWNRTPRSRKKLLALRQVVQVDL